MSEAGAAIDNDVVREQVEVLEDFPVLCVVVQLLMPNVDVSGYDVKPAPVFVDCVLHGVRTGHRVVECYREVGLPKVMGEVWRGQVAFDNDCFSP